MFSRIICIAAIISYLGVNNAGGQYYISPNGNDDNPGTHEQPFATLNRARDAVRDYKPATVTNTPVTVTIADGCYEMKEPFVLNTEDSGTEKFPVIYRAEAGANPVFSGGKKITGFSVNPDGIWEAKVPECIFYNWRFDQLYVNGERAVLARTPNKGFLEIGDIEEIVWQKGTARTVERAQQVFSFDNENFKPFLDIKDEEKENVRFRAFHNWDFTLRFIDGIEKDSSRIYTSGQGMKPWNPIRKGGRMVLENYAAALDMEGEWFLDRKGILHYYPHPGETPENSEVIAPALGNFISAEGDAATGEFVENICFEGIAFSHCHYRMPGTGSEPNQASVLIDAAIMLEGAKNIRFTNCEVSRTGQHAMWFGKGCSDCIVEHCCLQDLGGGGIYIGDPVPQQGADHTRNIRLHNNIIQSGGKEFPPAVGVWIGHSSDNEVSHNDIGNFYYTGVSVGWIWGYAESRAKRNKITCNHIHHIGWALLSDMAAVYTLGRSEGTEVSNNVVHHVHAYSYGGWGLYTDEGSSEIVMENNLVYNTKTGGFHQHYGKENIIRNNIFAFAKLYQVQCTRVEEHLSFNFEKNIIVFNEGMVLQGAWDEIDIQMDSNLYWNTNEKKYIFNEKSFREWQKSGHDAHSIIANPNFKDADNFDFEIKKTDNIKKIGFLPFDYSKAGVYGEKEWIEKAKLPDSILMDFDKAVMENMKEYTRKD